VLVIQGRLIDYAFGQKERENVPIEVIARRNDCVFKKDDART
jgi:hypothetical protein